MIPGLAYSTSKLGHRTVQIPSLVSAYKVDGKCELSSFLSGIEEGSCFDDFRGRLPTFTRETSEEIVTKIASTVKGYTYT